MKICSCCKLDLNLEKFYKCKSTKDGLQYRCTDCVKNSVLQWQKDNKEKVNFKNNEWKQKTKIWLSDNARAYTKNRAARRRTQTPAWVNNTEIVLFYKNCPAGYHVDHIIPIKGKTVSGLHTINNLQYLPALENLRKGNGY